MASRTKAAEAPASGLPSWLLWLVGVLIVVIGIPLWGYAYINGVRNTAVNYETRLSAQYLDNQNFLSTYVSGFYEMLGVANLKSEKLEKILTEAVKGRYDQKSGAGMNGSFINAIREAYPNLGTLDTYDKVVNYVSSQREGYRATQSKLLDMLRSFDNWRQAGMIRSWVVSSWLGVPSNRLVARIGSEESHGSDALKKMYQVVLTEGAVEAYKTGTMAPLKAR